MLSNRPPNARCHMTTIYPNDIGRNRFVLARDRKRRRFQEAFHEFSLTCWKLRDERRGPTTNCAYRSARISQETRTNAELDYGLWTVTLSSCLSGFKVVRQFSRNAKGRAHMLALPRCHCLWVTESRAVLFVTNSSLFSFVVVSCGVLCKGL